MDEFLRYLKIAGYLLIMASVVPLAGLCVSGSWKHAWAFTKAWLRVIGLMVAAGLLLALIIWPFMPSP